MKKNIETTHLEFDKSAFLIELIKHDNGLLYVEIAQTIFAENKTNRTIKINPSLLGDIIKILQNYHARVSIKHNEISSFLSEKDKGEIQ
ncbi:MAG: hypothetical protein ACPG49_13205, partial [Chitinophagales bacterium]